LSKEGWRALWRGNGANVAKIMPESAFKFFFNESFKEHIIRDKNNPKPHEFALGE
jgi:hypothetical protein